MARCQLLVRWSEAPVNDGSNYNCLKVDNAAFIKSDYMLENLWIKSLSILSYYGIMIPISIMPSNKASGADNQQERLKTIGWITGFVDGEGCFTVSITNFNVSKPWYQVFPEFVVTQSESSVKALERIKEYFQCGQIHRNKRKDGRQEDLMKYCVRSISDLQNKIIPFFEENKLATHKHNDFLIFRKIIKLMAKKHHLKKTGLVKIVHLMGTMNNRKKNPKFLESSETIRRILQMEKRYSPISMAT